MNHEGELASFEPETGTYNKNAETEKDTLSKIKALVEYANAVKAKKAEVEGTEHEERFRREIREKRAAGLYNQDFIGLDVSGLVPHDLEMFELVFGENAENQIRSDKDPRFMAYCDEVNAYVQEKLDHYGERGEKFDETKNSREDFRAACRNKLMEFALQAKQRLH